MRLTAGDPSVNNHQTTKARAGVGVFYVGLISSILDADFSWSTCLPVHELALLLSVVVRGAK